jgi:hypothetical protein
MQNKKIYGVMIPRQHLLQLASGMSSEISTHSLAQWLKIETNNKYTIVPRDFLVALMDVAETFANTDQLNTLSSNWNFEEMRGTWL